MDDTHVFPADNPIDVTTNNTSASDTSAPINSAGTVAPAPLDVGSDVVSTVSDVRLQRILDYTDESVAKVSAFEANVGAVNGDLLLISYRLRQALEEALQQGPAAFEELEQLIPAMDQFLKVTKQIDRFSQLAIKLGDSKVNSTVSKVKAILAESDAAASEESTS